VDVTIVGPIITSALTFLGRSSTRWTNSQHHLPLGAVLPVWQRAEHSTALPSAAAIITHFFLFPAGHTSYDVTVVELRKSRGICGAKSSQGVGATRLRRWIGVASLGRQAGRVCPANPELPRGWDISDVSGGSDQQLKGDLATSPGSQRAVLEPPRGCPGCLDTAAALQEFRCWFVVIDPECQSASSRGAVCQVATP